MSDEQRFFEGDMLEIRGHTYRVEQADITSGGGVLQYRLTPIDDAPPCTLRVNDDGYTAAMYYEASPVVVE